jgi:predicted component of type VI protein secretion system
MRPCGYESAVGVLDSLLRRLLSTHWDPLIRKQAMEKAAWLATYGATDAPKQVRPVARGLVALLGLADDLDLRPLLGQRLLELSGRLRGVSRRVPQVSSERKASSAAAITRSRLPRPKGVCQT